MTNPPFDYVSGNLYTAGTQPNTIHVSNTGLSKMYRKQLLEKAMSVFKFTLPDTWDMDYFRFTLFCTGCVTILNTDMFGVIPQFGTLSGYNVFYMPSESIVSNPLLPQVNRLTIGVDCEIIKMRPDFQSIMDIVGYYADQMALIAESFTCDIQNSKLAYVFGAKNQAQAQTFKKMFDDIYSGQPCVVVDKQLWNDDGSASWYTFAQNLKQTYIGDMLIDALNAVEDRFCTLIGINNANTDKRERLIKDEVQANHAEVKALSTVWLDEIRSGMDRANKMFGLSLSAELSDVGKGDVDNGESIRVGNVERKSAAV